MSSRKQSVTVSLENLAGGVLPKHVMDGILETEITVEDLLEWDQTHAPSKLVISRGKVIIQLRIELPLKKLLMILGGTGSLSCAAVLLKVLLGI